VGICRVLRRNACRNSQISWTPSVLRSFAFDSSRNCSQVGATMSATFFMLGVQTWILQREFS